MPVNKKLANIAWSARRQLLFIAWCCSWMAHVTAGQWSVQWQNSIALTPNGAAIGDLSGVTLLENMTPGSQRLLAISDSNGALFEIEAATTSGGVTSAVVSNTMSLADTSLDTEGLAFHPTEPSRVWVAYERDTNANDAIPGVAQYDLSSTLQQQAVALPSVWTTAGHVVNNRGFESLTRSRRGRIMWTANEEALTIDGNLATSNTGTVVRLQRIELGSTITASAQFAYEVDPVHGSGPDRSGLVDLVALPDGSLLALERSAAMSLPPFLNKIYQIDFAGATDISDANFHQGLLGQNYTPVTKTLLWSGTADGGLGANLEGLALAGRNSTDAWTLLGVTDDGDPLSGNLMVAFQLSPPQQYGDFNDDGTFDCQDIDGLVAAIVAGSNNPTFDLNGDGLVDGADQIQWLEDAAMANDLGSSYLRGDANLDGVVDGSDFVIWNDSKFTVESAWCQGNFDHNSVVDGSDFLLWNQHKFTASDGALLHEVPEPATAWLALIFATGSSPGCSAKVMRMNSYTGPTQHGFAASPEPSTMPQSRSLGNTTMSSDLQITDAIPVFNCVVYVKADPEGSFRGRVANLDGIQCRGGSQREVMAQIVPAFKQRVAALWQSEKDIPWIEPPAPIEPNEQRFWCPFICRRWVELRRATNARRRVGRSIAKDNCQSTPLENPEKTAEY